VPREKRRVNLSGHDPIEVLKRLLSQPPRPEATEEAGEQEKDKPAEEESGG